MSKKAYHVRNWSKYNKALVQRGRITFWIDEESISGWYANENEGRGRPKKYSNIAIIAIVTLKQVYGLTLRETQGFVASIFHLMGLHLETPSYTQVCRRQSTVKLPRLPKSARSIHMVLDSSGLKIFGEGEWKVRQHGWSKHRMWRKLHIGVDESSQLIVAAVLSKNDCGDDEMLPDLLEQYQGAIHQVSADGAYNSHACYDEIARYGAVPTIPTQNHPKHKPKTKAQVKRPRDKVVFAIQQQGRKEWKANSGYHRRSLAETTFYRYKQLLGGNLYSRKLENQCIEALVRCHALNKITLAGIPSSLRNNKSQF